MSGTSSSLTTPVERLATFFDRRVPQEKFHDSNINEIALLLECCGHPASKCPRTYIVLRHIGRLDLLNRLLSLDFSDGWFPVKAQHLPNFLDPSTKNLIVNNQSLIETPALELFNGKHCTVSSVEKLPFEEMIRIGSGNWGEVHKIQSKIDFKQYALKRIQRRAWGRHANEEVRQILAEMQNMKALQHLHVVRYVGSYATHSQLGVVMWPVADMDLAKYMLKASTDEELRPTLQGFFGCLAAAVTYLHTNNVKHRDIKPQNILVHKSNVLITDFGLSRDSLDVTSGYTLFTPRYAPPEMAVQEQRDESADIWCLGCVFLEMTAALHGYGVDWIKKYYAANHTRYTHYYANPKATQQLIKEWESSWNDVGKRPLQWIKCMLQEDRCARPPAAEIWEHTTAMALPEISATTFAGSCCAYHDDLPSSDRESLEIDMHLSQWHNVDPSSGLLDGTTSTTSQATLTSASPAKHVKSPVISRSSRNRISLPDLVIPKPLEHIIPSASESEPESTQDEDILLSDSDIGSSRVETISAQRVSIPREEQQLVQPAWNNVRLRIARFLLHDAVYPVILAVFTLAGRTETVITTCVFHITTWAKDAPSIISTALDQLVYSLVVGAHRRGINVKRLMAIYMAIMFLTIALPIGLIDLQYSLSALEWVTLFSVILWLEYLLGAWSLSLVLWLLWILLTPQDVVVGKFARWLDVMEEVSDWYWRPSRRELWEAKQTAQFQRSHPMPSIDPDRLRQVFGPATGTRKPWLFS